MTDSPSDNPQASPPQITRGCWIDLFESAHFTGKIRRVCGPALYLNLRNGDSDHPVTYLSLVTGPTAYAQLFAKRRPERSVTWLMPRQKLADLGAIKGDQELDSIRLMNRPPFPYEPGYSAFARLMGKGETTRRRRRRQKK